MLINTLFLRYLCIKPDRVPSLSGLFFFISLIINQYMLTNLYFQFIACGIPYR